MNVLASMLSPEKTQTRSLVSVMSEAVRSLLCPLPESNGKCLSAPFGRGHPGLVHSECSIIAASLPDERCFEDPAQPIAHTNTNNPRVP